MMTERDTTHPDFSPPRESTRELIERSLDEDRVHDDVTTKHFVSKNQTGTAEVITRDPGIFAGSFVAGMLFDRLPGSVQIRVDKNHSPVTPGDRLLTLQGPVRTLLSGERVLLNFLQRLSGIASYTKQFVQKIDDFDVVVTDTRKTTPGWRQLEKYAVRVGGGNNHRMDLAEMVLVKENHLRARSQKQNSESLSDEVSELTRNTTVQIEVSSLEDLDDIIKSQPDLILLDNMDVEKTERAVQRIRSSTANEDYDIQIEASGDIDLSSVRAYAETGVDRISVGRITHSAPSMNLSMQLRFD